MIRNASAGRFHHRALRPCRQESASSGRTPPIERPRRRSWRSLFFAELRDRPNGGNLDDRGRGRFNSACLLAALQRPQRLRRFQSPPVAPSASAAPAASSRPQRLRRFQSPPVATAASSRPQSPPAPPPLPVAPSRPACHRPEPTNRRTQRNLGVLGSWERPEPTKCRTPRNLGVLGPCERPDPPNRARPDSSDASGRLSARASHPRQCTTVAARASSIVTTSADKVITPTSRRMIDTTIAR